ncbi:MAG: trypsin-like peptidase domain-containing protein [Anaerolineales bacterium]|nr:trypsin-like peptidase domain-containing protein [Anaerolineales bacterium]MBP6210515.1 trypsin-like peptidase domain-containing protein [Anaerolineales bacterium]MBP8164304.1 trypsin-like peptidase domain-containing protein [Anaerolineales bacterium]
MTKNMLKELSDAMADAAERAGKSTVLVDARKKFPASGIAFSKDLILTADHVVERDEEIKVILSDGTEVAARVSGRDPGTDLAVLKLDSASAAPAEVSTDSARVGQFVLAVGRPSAQGIESSFGTINSIGGPVRTGRGSMLERYIKTDVVSYPGFSGGPLVNGDGTILGINTSGFGNGGAITIPADVAWKIADTLSKHGKIKRGYLGIRSQMVQVSDEMKRSLKREQQSGLLVVGLEENSPAGKGGLLVGDILVGVNGEAVAHQDDLFVRLSGDVVGKSVPLNIVRGGKLESISVVIGER